MAECEKDGGVSERQRRSERDRVEGRHTQNRVIDRQSGVVGGM